MTIYLDKWDTGPDRPAEQSWPAPPAPPPSQYLPPRRPASTRRLPVELAADPVIRRRERFRVAAGLFGLGLLAPMVGLEGLWLLGLMMGGADGAGTPAQVQLAFVCWLIACGAAGVLLVCSLVLQHPPAAAPISSRRLSVTVALGVAAIAVFVAANAVAMVSVP